jgi:hypothetical protein
MKKLPIAAAALLFGTSAFAMMPSPEPSGTWMQKDPYAVQPAATVAPAYDEAPALQPAAVDNWKAAEPESYTADESDAALKADMIADAKAVDVDKADAGWVADEDADAAQAKLAAYDAATAGDAALVQPASLETGFSDDTTYDAAAPAESADVTDMGGSSEAMNLAAADVTPQAAAQNYPACRPGPGDDRCIQLYEPGVREELASWTQPTGGFAGASDTQVAMGGPYEPVADSASETERLNQQALADSNRAIQTAQADEPIDDSAIETAMADDQGNVAADEQPADDEDLGEV